MAFRSIFTMVFDRLFQFRVGVWPAGLEPPAGARNRRKYGKRSLRDVATKGTIPITFTNSKITVNCLSLPKSEAN